MAIKIGSISISLTAETSSFQAGMDKASQVALSSSKNIEKSFMMMGTAITAATTAAVGALGYLIDRTQDTVFQMQKMAQQAGVSLESFSKMAYAAKVAGMPVDQLAVIMTRISHSAYEAAAGSKQAATAYAAFGVNVHNTNGSFKTADQIMLDLAKSSNKFSDSAGKTGAEMTVMGRSGAQAAELMHVLATRFDEISAKADKVGAALGPDNADKAQKLHDSFVDLEEAAFGLSVRLLSNVSPALDKIISKFVEFVGNADNMRQLDVIGQDIAHGVTLAGEAVEFLVKHLDEVKMVLESLLAIRLGGIFIPMVLSAAGATGIFGKLGIASLNLTGSLLGIRRMGTLFAPLIEGATSYATAIGGLAVSEGVAAAGSLALEDALLAAKTAMTAFMEVVPEAAAIAAAFYLVATELNDIRQDFDLANESGKGFWDVQVAKSDEARSSLSNYLGVLKATFGFKDALYNADMAKRLGIKNDANGITNTSIQLAAPGRPKGYADDPTMGGEKKQDFPDPKGPAKIDELTKRLKELHDRAVAAQAALRLVGASPEMQQDAEIAKKYALFLDEASTAKRKLTAAEMAAAHTDIETEVKAGAAEKYNKALYDLSISLTTSVEEHEAMAAAVGKSAQAMQDAAVKAKVSQEMQKAYGNDWASNPLIALDAQMTASRIRDEMNKSNLEADAKSANSQQLQIDAQDKLNASILEGSDARRAAAVVNEQASVRSDFASRGDTDTGAMQKQLDAIQQKSDKEAQAADLERASAMDVSLRYQEQKKSIDDAVTAATKFGHAIDYRQILAANKEAWMQYNEAQDKAILATGSMADGMKVAFDQMARDTESAAQQMHDSIMSAIGSMNDAMANIMTEKHERGTHQVSNQFAGAFRGIGNSLAKKGLEKAESGILKGAGFGKPDGTSQNPWYVKLVQNGAGSSSGSMSSILAQSQGSTTSSKNAGTGVGSVVGGILHSLLGGQSDSSSGGSAPGGGGNDGDDSSIVPFYANGTDSVVPGMASIVGEKGPEVFVPPSAGAIVPNSKLRNGLGGDSHTWNIDARNSHDPAQTVALIDNYMKTAAPKIMAGTMKAVSEKNLRVASSARRP